ncbi:DEAD/DEAH box helicase [Bartonella sp. HY406]|uniref:DEAD/DEAH box helicase n=1 Tax=Bartonella sp. HY406 TaxID=2979331 RepID=UPI0021C9D547|nr:DEAD/DEAH box helicase [Bartonella sp. HY406]UXN05123.1 DEAD/DEAH box helicase [Bartonella sp. HY406]
MTERELQNWLYETSLNDELQNLSIVTAQIDIENIIKKDETFNFDWQRLLFAASILVRSENTLHREASLRIATGAILLSNSDIIRDAAAVIFEKLSNHRAILLAEQRGYLTPDLETRLGVLLRIENQRKQLENSILLEASGELLPVNQFQHDFWKAASNNKAWLSASAPTASGKTFLVLKWLVDSIATNKIQRVIYLAPTRALVSEIETTLNEIAIQAHINIEIYSFPSVKKYNDTKASDGKCVFVFTQERLHLLANILQEILDFDLIVIDEAHKIGDQQRGVIMQDAIERLIRRSPNIRVIFISPATKNPEILLDDAPENIEKFPINSDATTVLQNIIIVQQVPRKPKEWALKIRYNEKYLPLGSVLLPSAPSSQCKKIAFIAATIGKSGGTLVYSNGKKDAEEIANLISQLVQKVEPIDEELMDFANLVRKCIHKNYQLAPFIELGVAFHYGNMPSLIRLEIERLFKIGKIKFLVCTSTLMEGVNLSCKNIVVRGPKKGIGTPMEPQDFWNLAGRAGRWGNEFQGNIICIDTSNESVWPYGVPQRTSYPIQRETDIAISKINDLAQYIEKKQTGGDINEVEVRTFEQVSAYLTRIFVNDGSLTETPWAKRYDEPTLKLLAKALTHATEGMTIEADIGIRNPGVNLIGLQKLLNFFSTYKGEIEDLLIAPPESDDAYERLLNIMAIINENILLVFKPQNLIPLHGLTILQWLKGFSLPEIINKRIEYKKRRGETPDIAKIIRNTLEMVEKTARFLAPRYLSAYVDVLNYHLKLVGREDLIDNDLDIAIALELGVSSITLRSLMELGISRISAVELYKIIAFDNLDEEACIKWIKKYDSRLDNIGLPSIIVREIREKINLKEKRKK